MIKKTDIILSMLSGAMLVAGFPPYDIYFLPWLSLVPFLIALRNKNMKRSFLLGIIMGLAYFLGTIYWVYHSMYVYGYLPLSVSIIILLLLCLYLSLYIGSFALLYNYIFSRSPVPASIAVPVVWVTLEFARTYALTGYPWALLGYTQYTLLPVIQIADITGIYGVSFLVASVNGAVYDMTLSRHTTIPGGSRQNRWQMPSAAALLIVVLIAAVIYGTGKLNEEDLGHNITISIVQGNIPQDKKWDYRFQQEVIDTYKKLTLEVSENKPDLIVWPETAVPFVFGRHRQFTEEVTGLPTDLGTYLLFGSMMTKGRDRLANSAVLLSPSGEIASVYDKIHLVPYGEYVPLRNLLPFVDKLTAGSGDFAEGLEPVVMETPFAKISTLICYEIIFPGLVRKFADNGADLLVTITNDAWFGRTAAPYQHFSMAVFRAIENRVPVARAANTGVSGFIDSRGRIMNSSEIFVEATLTETVSTGTEKSFYAEYGDIFVYLCIGSFMLLLAGRYFTKI